MRTLYQASRFVMTGYSALRGATIMIANVSPGPRRTTLSSARSSFTSVRVVVHGSGAPEAGAAAAGAAAAGAAAFGAASGVAAGAADTVAESCVTGVQSGGSAAAVRAASV